MAVNSMILNSAIMKRHICLLAVILGLCACGKDGVDTRDIVLDVDGAIGVEVSTRVQAVTAVPSSLFWSATTGSSGSSEVSKWGNAQASVSGGRIVTGKTQTATPTTYNYYLSNREITFSTTGSYIYCENGTDCIAGKATTPDSEVGVTLGHVFARTGSLTLNTQSGYTLSNVSWQIESNTGAGISGNYNIAKGTWSGQTGLSRRSLTSSSDLYLIPGSYTFTVTYTLTKGDYSRQFTRSASATLVAGRINNITSTATGGDAKDITLTVSLTGWGSNSIGAQFI